MAAVRLARTALVLLSLVLMLTLAGAGAIVYLNRPAAAIPGDGVYFHVESGETLLGIASRLEGQGLIRSARLLVIISKILDTESSFQAGPYRILPGSSTAEIHTMLASGARARKKVTIPEGWTVRKIARLLDEEGITTEKEFMEESRSPELLERLGVDGQTFEGYLFPDTYFFPEVYSAQSIIRTMVENFFRVVEEIVPDYRKWDREEFHREIILASIVEREYRIPEEAPLIVSVFKNRMKHRIGLESCATLEYIITEIQGKPHPEYLTLEDKSIDSPYNTYKWYGLPPGPISNPGRIALNATFHSAETEYYYFVLKDPATGEHYFSKSLDEHNEAKFIYLKGVKNPEG